MLDKYMSIIYKAQFALNNSLYYDREVYYNESDKKNWKFISLLYYYLITLSPTRKGRYLKYFCTEFLKF